MVYCRPTWNIFLPNIPIGRVLFFLIVCKYYENQAPENKTLYVSCPVLLLQSKITLVRFPKINASKNAYMYKALIADRTSTVISSCDVTFNFLISLKPDADWESVHMILGQLIDPRAKFALVHSPTPVTVRMSLSLPRGHFEGRVTGCTTPGKPHCRGNFSLHANRTQKFPRGKSSLAHAHYRCLE